MRKYIGKRKKYMKRRNTKRRNPTSIKSKAGDNALTVLIVGLTVAFLGSVIYYKIKGDGDNGEEPPNGELPPSNSTVASQLADIWDYVSGGGYLEGTDAIWAMRTKDVWLMYDVRSGIDQIGYFIEPDLVEIEVAQPVVLEMPGGTVQLEEGWNQFTWQD